MMQDNNDYWITITTVQNVNIYGIVITREILKISRLSPGDNIPGLTIV